MKRSRSRKINKFGSNNGPTPFFIVFTLLILLEMVSYLLNIIMPDNLFAYFEEISGTYFTKLAYFATVATFLILLLGYFIMPCRRWARQFQLRSIEKCSDATAIKLWMSTSVAILLLCLIAYARTKFTVPLILARNLNELDYIQLRFQTGELIGTEIIVLCQYVFLPLNTLTVFGIAIKRHLWLRSGTFFLYLLVGMFTLERSTLVIPVLVYFAARMSLKPLRWTMFLHPLIACMVFSGFMVAFSLTERAVDLRTLLSILIGRLVHGQWIGLPLYLSYYQDKSIGVSTVIHPYLKSFFDLKDTITPGSELMMEFFPTTISAGVVGNIPTLFIGEAYAIGGWLMVCVAIIHVVLFISICAWVFTQLPKTPVTCILYGIVVVKISMGLVLGYSMFMFSLLTLLILMMFLYIFVKNVIPHIRLLPKKEILKL
jgi:hypothetical protein